MFDAVMFQHLARHATIAAAHNQHALGGPMGQDRHMGQHFMIDEIIRFGHLHHAIKR